MKHQFWCPFPVISLVVVFLGLAVQGASARGGRGGGGFSRESPAAGGSFSSHSASRPEPQGSAQSNHQQYGSSAQSSRQQYGSSAQSSREQTATGMQSSREQTATGMQSSREQTATGMQSSAQRYHGASPYATSASTDWDAGVGVAAATTGVAIGTAAVSSMAAQPSSTGVFTMPTASQLCASPTVIPVDGMNYFKCGSAWYTQAFGPSGPTYVSVAPPPGF
jgi:hypothetical protein